MTAGSTHTRPGAEGEDESTKENPLEQKEEGVRRK